MIALFNYLLIFNVFAGGFVLFTSPFEFYVGYIFIIFFLILYILRYRNITINGNFLIILLVLTVSSCVNVYLEKDTLFLMTKQILGILITGFAYYFLIKVNKYEIDKLFKIYLRIALIVAIIGIFQEYSFLIGFKSGYNYSRIIPKWIFTPAEGMVMLRVNSILIEPVHFAISMAPALFVSLAAILRNNPYYLSKKAGILIIICYILTFSLVAYIVILLSLILILSPYIKRLKHLLLLVVIMSALVYSAYYYIPGIRMRVDDAIRVTAGSRETVSSHLTVFAYTSNAFVAFKSFISSPLFGRGLGSHPISYDEFIRPSASKVFWQKGYTGINKYDANSLFLLLLSETGLFGILVVFYFIFKFHLKNGRNKNLQIISNAIFVLFIIQLLRQGHYFYNGLFFFVWVYYFAYKISEPQNH